MCAPCAESPPSIWCTGASLTDFPRFEMQKSPGPLWPGTLFCCLLVSLKVSFPQMLLQYVGPAALGGAMVHLSVS